MSRHWASQFQREQLHRAAGEGDLVRVEDLLGRKYPVNRFDGMGRTPLHRAVEGGHLHVVDRLLRAGANVNANDRRRIGETPLADNVRRCSYEMVERLVAAGADPTIKGWMQLDALYRAGERNDANAGKIQRLLRVAADRRARVAASGRST